MGCNALVCICTLFIRHTLEGPDDMPAHIKCALTATQISLPFQAGELLLGTWQGIYLWEHRYHPVVMVPSRHQRGGIVRIRFHIVHR